MTVGKFGLGVGLIVLSVLLCAPVSAQTQTQSSVKEESNKLPQRITEMKQQLQQNQEQFLQQLKKIDPEAYESMRAQSEQSKKIAKIVQAFHSKQLSEQEAINDLYPLIKKQLEELLKGIDFRIEMLEKQLAELKNSQNDPDQAIRKQIDRLLGKSSAYPSLP